MISREEAVVRVVAAAWVLPPTRIELAQSRGYVLSEDATSDCDIPPFDKSSMDGYACRAEDAFAPLRVLEHIPAGRVPTMAITPGTCSKIMTGAPVPEGADSILIVEEIDVIDENTVRFNGKQPRPNFCLQGEDVRRGDNVLSAGTRLRSAHLPALASIGCSHPSVATLPQVAIMATGDELVPHDATPPPGKIRNSNSLQLDALTRNAGARVCNLGIIPDARDKMIAAWEDALSNNDVVLSTGGVSMGDYDLVPEILAHHGFKIHFDRVAIQPGKPVLFGTRGNKACFGLSGNPVSSFLQFFLFVRPFLDCLQGRADRDPVLQLPLAQDFHRKNGGREGWIPVRIDADSRLAPIEFHGSAHIHSFSVADGLIAFPQGETTLAADRVVPVHLLPG